MESFQDFIGSFSFDQRLAPYDIEGSIAHVRMLVKQRIIPSKDGATIIRGLRSIFADLKKGTAIPREEDIHYAVEKELIRRIGPAGGKMHTARSRNDQVALDLRMYLRDIISTAGGRIRELQRALAGQARKNADAVLPGYTHLQPAQPVLLAHHLLAYAWMLQRDHERLADALKRVTILPLGSAAMGGTSFPIDRAFVARELGFTGITENSMDAVSDRDFAIEFVSCASMIAMHLSRLCEELIVWSSAEFSFIRLADEFTSGSSIMPQKRNPDCAEIVRGKTGRVYGGLMALLTIMKGTPLCYNRDMQEDKPPLFDAADTILQCLDVARGMIESMAVDRGAMFNATERGFMAATELADHLARKGMPFRQAHGIIKEMVRYCVSHNKTFGDLTIGEFKRFSPLFGNDITRAIRPGTIVAAKTSAGGTSPVSVRRQLAKLSSVMKRGFPRGRK